MVKEVSAMLVETTILRPAMPFFPGEGACNFRPDPICTCVDNHLKSLVHVAAL